MSVKLNLQKNELYGQPQKLEFDKAVTLIGENGGGKSLILQSIFKQRLMGSDHKDWKVVCTSSGQNENYSQVFGPYLQTLRKIGRGLSLDCVFYDKPWVKLLIFLATALKPEGRVRGLLKENGYVKTGKNNEDNSTKLICRVKIDQEYADRIVERLKKSETDDAVHKSDLEYSQSLASFVHFLEGNKNYKFPSALKGKKRTLKANKISSIKFDIRIQSEDESTHPVQGGDGSRTAESDFGPEVAFFTQAADNDFVIDKSDLELIFSHKKIELDKVSDGEFQLLFLYALIDLFDSEQTMFLLDDIDSHLHYENIEKLWKVLSEVKGVIITATHQIDAILAKANDIRNVRFVSNGQFDEDNQIQSMIKRFGIVSRGQSALNELHGKMKHISVLDDESDWKIFMKLAERKGLDVSKLEDMHIVKKPSGYESTNDIFGKAKIEWVENLSRIGTSLTTEAIFLICDRDEAALKINKKVRVVDTQATELVKSIKWPKRRKNVFLLAWQRREIENYLISRTALEKYGKLGEIESCNNVIMKDLKAGSTGDDCSIGYWDVKDVIRSIYFDKDGNCDEVELQKFIDQIPPEEISEDIVFMYNFIIGKMKDVTTK